MSLLAYNLTGAPVTLTGVTPAVVLPLSSSPPSPGPAVNVTSEFAGLTGGQFAALQTQALGTVKYAWSTGVAEYATPGLTVVDSSSATVTTGAMSLYVATTGSDSNNGTAIGTPLLTLQAALNKIPKEIKHLVTVNLAAGTYTGNSTWDSPKFSGDGSLVVTGTGWVNATLGSGNATGTLTAYTALDAPNNTLGTLTDAGQGWAVNALKGLYVTITSGAAVGLNRVITSNTATSITVNAVLTGLVGTETYAIQIPATSLTGTTTQGTLNLVGLSGATTATSSVIVSDLNINVSAIASSAGVSIRGCKVISSSTPGSIPAAYVILRRLRVLGTAAPAVFVTGSWAGTSSNSTFNYTTTSATLYVTGDSLFSDVAGYHQSGYSVTVAHYGGLYGVGSVFGIPVSENTGTGSAWTTNPTGLTYAASALFAPYNAIAVTATGSGLAVGTGGNAQVTNKFKSAGGVGVTLSNGARARFSTVPTLTTSVSDYVIDGVNYTSAAITGLTPKVVVGVLTSTLQLQ